MLNDIKPKDSDQNLESAFQEYKLENNLAVEFKPLILTYGKWPLTTIRCVLWMRFIINIMYIIYKRIYAYMDLTIDFKLILTYRKAFILKFSYKVCMCNILWLWLIKISKALLPGRAFDGTNWCKDEDSVYCSCNI